MVGDLTHEAYRARDNWDFWGAMEKAFDEYSSELTKRRHFGIYAPRAPGRCRSAPQPFI